MFVTYGLDTTDTPERIAEYAKYGAEEFFGGFVPKEWVEKYGWEVCPNRRPMGGGYNYTQATELQETAKAIHKLGCRLNLAINAHDNGSERLEGIRRTVEIMEQFNPDGYIVADPGLMCSLAKWGIDRPIHLSTGVGCFSADAVRFFCEHFNVRRVVIPRKMTINEIRRMIEKMGDLKVEYEVMIIGYRCYFNDENCHSIHSGARRNLCGDMQMAPYACSNRLPDNWKDMLQAMIDKGDELMKPGSELDDFCKQWKKNEPQDPRFKMGWTAEGISPLMHHALFQNCGLCAIRELREMGVHALKVPLRGASNYKLEVLKLVHAVMTHPNPTPDFCKGLLNSPAFCSTPTSCYYNVPEAHL